MTRSPLRCSTSIIRSSALVQASSSLSIGCTCAWPRRLPVTEMHFCYFSREFHVYEACTGTAQLGASLAAPLASTFKQSSFACMPDMLHSISVCLFSSEQAVGCHRKNKDNEKKLFSPSNTSSLRLCLSFARERSFSLFLSFSLFPALSFSSFFSLSLYLSL